MFGYQNYCMRYLLPFLLFSFIGVFSGFEAEGQALQGGTITTASGAAFNGNTEVRRCSPGNISLSGPSTLASGGNGNYLYYPQYKTATQDWTDYTDGSPVPNTSGYMPPFIANESTQFRRKVVDGSGAVAYSTIMTFTLVQPVLGVISPTTQTIPYNTAPTAITQTNNFDLNGIPIESGQWESSSSATGPWTIISNANGSLGTFQPPALTESRYYRRTVNVPVTFGCNNLSTNVSTVNVNPCSTSPLVSSGVQMYYDLSQCNYEFTIYSPDPQSSGGTRPYFYLWEKKEPNLTNWSAAPGTNTGATYYRIGNIPSGTKFRRRLTDACGTVVYSNEVTHNFYNPLYEGAIGSNQNIGFGGTPALLTNFSSPENANEINWQVSTNNINWSNINGATGLTYQPPALTQTTYYRRRAVNYTCPDAYTYVVTITVTDLTGGTISTTTPLFCNSGSAIINSDLAAGAGSSPLTYTWQSKVGNGNWTDISSTNSATYTTPTITQTTRYRRKVTDAVSAVTYSNEVEISVIDIAGIITSPIGYNGCQSATLTAINLNGATYQWQQLINSNWTDIPSATTNSYVATTNGSYRVFVNLGTCSGYSNPAAINLSASEPGVITNRWVFRGYNGLSDNVNNLVYRGFYEAENSTLNFNTNAHWLETASPSSANGASPAITGWTGCGVNTDEFTLIAKRQGFDAGTYTISLSGKNYGRYKLVVNGQTLFNNFSPYTAFTSPSFPNLTLNAQSEVELWLMDVINPSFPGSPINMSIAFTYVSDITGGTISTTTPLFCNSGTATLNSNLTASGGSSPLTYAWQSKVGNGNWTDIPSTNTLTYITPTLTQTTRYRRKVTDAVSAVTYSNEIEISVIDIAGIITSPILLNGCQSATITATNLNGATYQWQQLINSNWTDIPTVTANTYITSTNGSYRVFVNLGTCSGYSNAVDINLSTTEPNLTPNKWLFKGYNGLSDNVNSLVYRGYYEAENNTLNYNTNAHWLETASPSSANGASPAITGWTGCGVNTDEFTLIAKRQGFDAGTYTISLGGKSYGRYKLVVNGQILYNNFSPYIAFTSPSFPNLTLNAQSEVEVWMMDVINPSFPGSPINMSIAFTNFVPTPVVALTAGSIGDLPTTLVCLNEAVTINSTAAATGGTAPLTYQWQSKTGAGNWTDISGANGTSYTTPNLTVNTEFRRKVTDATNAVAYSNIVAFSVYSQTFNPGTFNITPLICSATTPPTYVGGTAASGGKLPYSYVWERDNVAVTNPSSNENLAGLFTASNYQGNYSRKATDGCGVTISTTTKMVAVQDIAGGAVSPTNQTIFSGNTPVNITNTTNAYHTGTFNPDAGDIAVNITYQWQSATNLNGPWSNIQGATAKSYQSGPLTQTTYFRRVVTEDYCNKNNEEVFATVTVNALPPNVSTLFGGGITTSNFCVSSGNQPAIITENAASSDGIQPYVFVWESWTATSGSWSTIAGANSATYQPGILAETTKFRRKTSDQSNQTAYSNEITIVVNASIAGGTISPSSQTVVVNIAPTLPFSLSSSFSGGSGNFNYQWQEATNSNGPWVDILGATANTYFSLGSANPTTIYYRLKATDAGCNAEGFSNIASLTVTSSQTISNLFGGGIATTATCVILPATPAPIFVSAASSDGVQPYTYEWQMWNSTLGNWTIVPGATNPDLIPPAVSTDTKFRRKTIDRMGNIAFSNKLSYTVVAAILNGGTIAFNTSFTCAANSINVGLMNSQADATGGSTLNYQWQLNNGSGWVDIANATAATYTHGNINVTTSFRRKVTDACGRVAYSNSISATISASAVITLKGGLVSGPFITCSNTNLPSGIVDVVNACGNGNLNYQWELWDGNAWVIINGATTSNYTPTPISVTSKYRRKVTDACGNVAYSNEVIIHVYPEIESGAITPMSQELCTNVTPGMLSLATNCHYTPGTVTYQWQVADNSNGPWTDIGGASSNNYQPPTLTQNKYYRLKVNSTTCSAVAYTNVAAVTRLSGCRVAAPSVTPIAKSNPEAKKVAKPMLFPNPLSYQNTFTIQMPDAGRYTVTVRHLSGKIEPAQTASKTGNTVAVSLMRKIPKGTYFVTITNENKQWTEKLIVQ